MLTFLVLSSSLALEQLSNRLSLIARQQKDKVQMCYIRPSSSARKSQVPKPVPNARIGKETAKEDDKTRNGINTTTHKFKNIISKMSLHIANKQLYCNEDAYSLRKCLVFKAKNYKVVPRKSRSKYGQPTLPVWDLSKTGGQITKKQYETLMVEIRSGLIEFYGKKPNLKPYSLQHWAWTCLRTSFNIKMQQVFKGMIRQPSPRYGWDIVDRFQGNIWIFPLHRCHCNWVRDIFLYYNININTMSNILSFHFQEDCIDVAHHPVNYEEKIRKNLYTTRRVKVFRVTG